MTNIQNTTGHKILGTLMSNTREGKSLGDTVEIPIGSAIFTRVRNIPGLDDQLAARVHYEVFALTPNLDLVLIAQPSAAGLEAMLTEIAQPG